MVLLAARSISETKRAQYLLGISSPAEREQIESEYFEDDDAFQEMLTAEDDLIDAYVRGELTREERRKVEKSFVSSLRERDRVQFARALASNISASRPAQTKRPGPSLDIFKALQSAGLLRTATLTAAIVFVAALAWLANDRRRMTDELRQLRAESAELSKRTEALQRNNETERTRSAEIVTQLAELRAQSDKPRPRDGVTTATERTQRLPEVKEERARFERIEPKPGEQLVTVSDATLPNSFEPKKITELPLDARDVPNLLSMQPGTPRGGFIAQGRSDQANVTLDGLKTGNPFHDIYLLNPRNTSSSVETTISIPTSLSWIRFQLSLETAAIHEDYRIIINTADGRSLTSVDWTEPLTPDQTIIDTPAISTSDLPPGDYVLLLMGKEPEGSFVKVAEYCFKFIKYQ